MTTTPPTPPPPPPPPAPPPPLAPTPPRGPVAASLRRRLHAKSTKVLAVLGVLFGLAVWVAHLDLHAGLGHVDLTVLSGSEGGNYHAIVTRLRALARKRGGTVRNLASEGSVDNVARLGAASRSCEAQFALVQGGLPIPEAPPLDLVGRLPKAESVFILGRAADRFTDLASLAKARIGIGPEGSGTAHVARQIFSLRELAGLGLTLSTHELVEQRDLAARGELDLAVFVMDEDAAFIDDAVRERGLQLLGFAHDDVLARRFPFLRTGRIGAGEYDPVRMLPPVDKQVLRVDTLVLGNRCARRSQTLGLIAALADAFPDFVRHNHDTPNRTGLELDPAAKSFFDDQRAELLDVYLPRVGDVMPPSNWVHVVMGVSVLFNLMGLANRFLLWRIDAARVKAEHDLGVLFGQATTLGDIARSSVAGPGVAEGVDRLVVALETLAARSRRQSLSVLVPMGQEMAYRYQEGLIHETLAVLRAFRLRSRAGATAA